MQSLVGAHCHIGLCQVFPQPPPTRPHRPLNNRNGNGRMYLVQVDDRLPEVVLLLVEVPHADLSEVTRMVLSPVSVFRARRSSSCLESSNLVHVGTVVVLTTSQTTTTRMLAVLSYTAVTGGNMAAAVKQRVSPRCSSARAATAPSPSQRQSHHRSNRALNRAAATSSRGQKHVLLAGLRSSGRHGDVGGAVAFPVFCVEDWEWVVMILRLLTLGAGPEPGKSLGERASQP